MIRTLATLVVLGTMNFLGATLATEVVTPDTTTTEGFVLDIVLRLGFPTAALFAIAKGWFVQGKIYDQSVTRNEAADARIVENETLLRDKVVPALTENTLALQEVIKLVGDFSPLIADLVRERERHEREDRDDARSKRR